MLSANKSQRPILIFLYRYQKQHFSIGFVSKNKRGEAEPRPMDAPVKAFLQ